MANIVRWDDPFAGLTSLHGQLDDMFNNFFTGLPAVQMPQAAMPAMDIYNEDDKALVAEVQVPGFKKDDVDVSVHNGVLEIKGEKHEKEEDKQGKNRSYMLRESHASFYRRLRLPEYADEEHVDAKFDGGVLKVTIPFKDLPKPKKVAITEGKK
jgi:HSP20 family protein